MRDLLNTQVAANMCLRQTITCMLPAKAFETRKRLLTLSSAQPRQNKKANFKIHELFIHRDILCIIDSLSKLPHRSLGSELQLLQIFLIIIIIF